MEQKSFEQFQRDVTNIVENMPTGNEPKPKSIYEYCSELSKKLKEGVLNGKSGLLPNEQGEIDVKQAYNMKNHERVNGLTQVMLLHRMGELGVTDTGAFVTDVIIDKAIKNGVDTSVRKGQRPLTVPFELKDGGGLVVNKWYHISQIEKPENLKSYLLNEMSQDAERVTEYNKEHHPDWKPKSDHSKKQMDLPNTTLMNLNANSTCQYIGQVLAASQKQIRLRVTPEQVEKFKENLVNELERLHTNGEIDKLAVQKLSNNSVKVCNSIVWQLNKRENPEQIQGNNKTPPNRHRKEPSIER